MIQVSQSAIESVVRDIQSGDTPYVSDFFAIRPEWLEQQDATTAQTDEQQEEKQEEVAQA
jgi:hypothetical protein